MNLPSGICIENPAVKRQAKSARAENGSHNTRSNSLGEATRQCKQSVQANAPKARKLDSVLAFVEEVPRRDVAQPDSLKMCVQVGG
jgi:hypothetical protein